MTQDSKAVEVAQTWYRGRKWGAIDGVDVVRDSDHSVFYPHGKRELKESDWHMIAPDRAVVVAWIRRKMEHAVLIAENDLKNAAATLAAFNQKEPQ